MEYVYRYIFDEIEVELSVTVDGTDKETSLEKAEKFMIDHGFEYPHDHLILFGQNFSETFYGPPGFTWRVFFGEKNEI